MLNAEGTISESKVEHIQEASKSKEELTKKIQTFDIVKVYYFC